MIAIIDYDAGNLRSVEKALQTIGCDTLVTRDRDEIMAADKIILPGVGAFGDAMGKSKQYGLVQTIHDAIDVKKPFLGICLGLQLLFESSEETEGVAGLGVLPGKIMRIPDAPGIKIPHMGWNSLNINPNSRLFKDIPENTYVYFVHSYYLQAGNPEDVAATTEYSTLIHAAVEHYNIFACQFHPEKSSTLGLRILDNFAKM